MTWGRASSARLPGLTATDYQALLRNSKSPATCGPVSSTGPRPKFAGVLALTQIEVMSAALDGMSRSDPRRVRLAKAICSARSAMLRGPQ